MKLKDGFITYEADGQQMLVSAGNGDFNGLVRSNSTAGFIVDCLKSETNEAEIISKLLDKYEVSEQVVSEDLRKILDTLRRIGALDE